MSSRLPRAIARFMTRLRWRRERGERGAVLILTAASLVMLMGSVAMVVDIGHQVSTKRKLQVYADQCASDALSALGSTNSLTAATTAATDCLARNGFFAGGYAMGRGAAVPAPEGAGGPNTIDVAVGTWDKLAQTFTPLDGAASGALQQAANAIHVCLGTIVHHDFIPSDATIHGCSTAIKAAGAGVQLGSFLSRVTIGASEATLSNAFLGSELGGAVNLTAAGYQGLADSRMTLGQLADAANVGSVNSLLDQSMTIGDWFTLLVTALNNDGQSGAAASVNQLKTVFTSGGGGAIGGGTTMKLRQFITTVAANGSQGNGSIADGSASASAVRQMKVRTIDLVEASVQAAVANGTNLVHLTLPITIPGVDSTTLDFSFIELPQWAWGPVGTVTKTAQMRMYFVETLTQTVPGFGGVHVQLPIYIEGAGATGTISSILCKTPVTDTPVGIHVDTRAAQTSIGAVDDPTVLADLNRTVSLRRLGDLASIGGALTVSSSADHTVLPGATVPDLSFVGPFERAMQTVGSYSPSMARDLTPQLNVQTSLAPGFVLGLGLSTALINTTVSAAVQQQLDFQFDTGVLDKVSTALGVRVAGADVWNPPQLLCDAPQLVQ